MRVTLPIVACLFVAGLSAGCAPADRTAAAVAPRPGETATERLDEARTDTKDAAQATRDYAYSQKAEFVAEMKKDLAKIEEELDRLSAKIDSSSGAAKADAKAKLELVREKSIEAKKKMDLVENATEPTWDEVKGGVKKSYGELKESFAETRQWLSDKIAP